MAREVPHILHKPEARGDSEYIFITHSSSSQQFFIALETNMSLGHDLGWLWEMKPLYNEERSTVTVCKYSKQQNMVTPVSAIIDHSYELSKPKCTVIWSVKSKSENIWNKHICKILSFNHCSFQSCTMQSLYSFLSLARWKLIIIRITLD